MNVYDLLVLSVSIIVAMVMFALFTCGFFFLFCSFIFLFILSHHFITIFCCFLFGLITYYRYQMNETRKKKQNNVFFFLVFLSNFCFGLCWKRNKIYFYHLAVSVSFDLLLLFLLKGESWTRITFSELLFIKYTCSQFSLAQW